MGMLPHPGVKRMVARRLPLRKRMGRRSTMRRSKTASLNLRSAETFLVGKLVLPSPPPARRLYFGVARLCIFTSGGFRAVTNMISTLGMEAMTQMELLIQKNIIFVTTQTSNYVMHS